MNTLACALVVTLGLFSLSERASSQSVVTSQPTVETKTNSKAAFEVIKTRADQGDVIAQNELGLIYAKGEGVERQPFEAARWFRRAAEQGYVWAQYHLALYWLDGERAGYKEAIYWYRKAAEQGHAKAQNRLGVMYAKGLGISEDVDEAIKWFRAAAENGDAAANKNLAATLGRKAAKDFRRQNPQGRQWTEATKLKPIERIAQAAPPQLPAEPTTEIKTKDGVTYRVKQVQKVGDDGLTIEFVPEGGGLGVAKLKFDNLPESVRQQYPAQIAALRERQASEQAEARRVAAQEVENLRTLSRIAFDYYESHTYLGSDVFACVDMACDVWNMVVTKGIKAMLMVGNVERHINFFEEANHAWVLAEVSPNKWVAIEATGGRIVTARENSRYFRGVPFATPRELQDAQSLRRAGR